MRHICCGACSACTLRHASGAHAHAHPGGGEGGRREGGRHARARALVAVARSMHVHVHTGGKGGEREEGGWHARARALVVVARSMHVYRSPARVTPAPQPYRGDPGPAALQGRPQPRSPAGLTIGRHGYSRPCHLWPRVYAGAAPTRRQPPTSAFGLGPQQSALRATSRLSSRCWPWPWRRTWTTSSTSRGFVD
eukprot:207339-Chlamydomonas_euryale.AAC.3